jgi:hypothetical protein
MISARRKENLVLDKRLNRETEESKYITLNSYVVRTVHFEVKL